MVKEKKSKWKTVIKVVIYLTILSFFLSLLISLFVDDGFENLDGNTAIIEINGPIVAQKNGDFSFTESTSSDDIRKLIRRANKNDKIKAIIFEINSPGGSAVASDEIAIEVKKVNKTKVAWIREIGTSGAYWIASSSDHIIANRMSITGSIGVISSYLSFPGFLEDHNVTYERLVTGKFKDTGSPFKELTSEERIMFQRSLDKIHDYFVEEVAVNRNMKKRDVAKIATGQFYLGVDAKELGLIDELGSRQEVLDYVEEQIGEDVDLVRYRKQKGILSAFSRTMNEKFFFVGKGIGDAFFTQAERPQSISIKT